jgi:hypothetical protein
MDVERVVEILCRYRHQSLGEDEIEIIPDLQLVNVFAARVLGGVEYLVRADDGSVEVVDFGGWPPMPPSMSEAGPAGAEAAGAGIGAERVERADAEAAARPWPGDALGPRVENLMSRPVYLCDAEATLADAARLMWERDCGALPVSSAD